MYTKTPRSAASCTWSGSLVARSAITGQDAWSLAPAASLFAAPLLMNLFRSKYPRWWFDWHLELTRFSSQVSLYAALLDDRYPSTDEAQSMRLAMPYPDARTELNRWLPLVTWLLAIPRYIVLVFLWIAAFVCIVIGWFAILFTGRYPRELFDFVVGVGRWSGSVRGTAYAFLLEIGRAHV
jgi:hypothetical protein